MADYSQFPFENFTVAEVFALARESRDIGDEEFVRACMEAIRLNRCGPTPLAPDAASLRAGEEQKRAAASAE